MRPELNEIAKQLIENVRDRAIQMADVSLRPNSNGPVARRWRAAGVKHAEIVIPDVVDMTLFALLNAIDEELLRLIFLPKEGGSFDLCKDGQGELAGWYMMNDGWRTTYSKERFVDDIADVNE